MHIAIIGSKSSTHIVRWVNALVQRGYQVTLFSMHEALDHIHRRVDIEDLPFKNPAGYVLNIPYLRSRIRDLNPDIVHSFYALGHGFLGRMTGFKPHIVSVLGSDIFDDIHRNSVLKLITLKNIEKADVVCSTSKVMAKEIRKYINRDIEITPFGIDIEKFSPTGDRSVENEDYDLVVGTVKYLEEKYGVDILLKAFSKFCERHTNKKFKLIIVGDGSKMKALKKLSRSLDIKENCEFTGRVDHQNIPGWLSKFDIYAALSRFDSESFGVAILEACAMEVPVVVSNVGGLPEIVDHLKSGIVVEKENPEEAFKALDKLYLDKNFSKKLAQKGRQKVLENYNWIDSVELIESIYQRIIKFC